MIARPVGFYRDDFQAFVRLPPLVAIIPEASRRFRVETRSTEIDDLTLIHALSHRRQSRTERTTTCEWLIRCGVEADLRVWYYNSSGSR